MQIVKMLSFNRILFILKVSSKFIIFSIFSTADYSVGLFCVEQFFFEKLPNGRCWRSGKHDTPICKQIIWILLKIYIYIMYHEASYYNSWVRLSKNGKWRQCDLDLHMYTDEVWSHMWEHQSDILKAKSGSKAYSYVNGSGRSFD